MAFATPYSLTHPAAQREHTFTGAALSMPELCEVVHQTHAANHRTAYRGTRRKHDRPHDLYDLRLAR